MNKDMLQIKTSNILDQESFNELESLSNELKATFESVQIHRTRTEMEVSVLNELKHPTPASKYWQSVREQNAMAHGVALLSFDYRAEKVRIKILEQRIANEEDELKRELLQIKLERKQYILKDMERTAKSKVREIKDWSEIKQREAKDMSDEELADVGNHQLISYTRRWINQAIEMGNNGSPSERQNLLGQLNSGLSLCIKNGIINDVIKVYNKSIQKKIMLEYGVK